MMALRLWKRMLIAAIATVLAIGSPVGLEAPPPAVQAQIPNPTGNPVVGFINVLSGANRRSRIYRNARATQQEMDAYYDNLINTARSQLQSRELMGANQAQLRVYIKMIAALEAERAAVTRQIEAEKKQAHYNFERSAGQQVIQVLTQRPGAQRIFGDMRQTIGELRQNAQAIRSALDQGKPVDVLMGRLTDRLTRFPILRDMANDLGYGLGNELDQALGHLLSRTADAVRDAQSNLDQAIGEANAIDNVLASLQTRQHRPVSLVEDGSPLKNVRGVQRTNAALDAHAEALANLSALLDLLSDQGISRNQLRDHIRNQLLQQRVTHLTEGGVKTGQVACYAASQSEYLAACAQLGLAVEKPRDPQKATYLVCQETTTNSVIYAALIGLAAGQATEEPGATEDVEPLPEATEQFEPEPEPDPEADPGPESGEIPVGTYQGGTTISGSAKGYQAEIDQIVVTIDESGEVSGTLQVKMQSKETQPNGCTQYQSQEMQGQIGGKVEGPSSGRVLLVVKWHFVGSFSAGCGDSIDQADTLASYLIFSVSDGVMHGTAYRSANDQPYFSFEARRR